MLFGITISLRFSHCSNAPSPMYSTDSGISIDSKF